MPITHWKRILTTVLALIACSPVSGHSDPDELAAPLMKLTRAVEAELVYGGDGEPRSDTQLLKAAMKSDPALEKEFKDTQLVLQHNQRRLVILVCSSDGKLGWLEDASWTPEIDKHWHKTARDHPCQMTLELKKD